MTIGEGEAYLREVLGRYRRARQTSKSIDERPSSAYEMITRERLEELMEEVKRMKSEIADLRWLLGRLFVSLALIFVGVLVDMMLRSVGGV